MHLIKPKLRVSKKNIISFNVAIITLMYISSVVSNNVSISGYGRLSYTFFLVVSLVGVYVFIKNLKKPKVVILPFFIKVSIVLMLIFSTLGSVIIQDYRAIYTYFPFIVIFLIYWKFSLDAVFFNNEVGLLVAKLIIIINFSLLILSLAIDGIYIFRYEGIFDMPNSMGRFAGYTFLMAVVYLLFLEKKSKYAAIMLLATFMSFVPLILSNSRAPILASFVSLLIVLSVYARIKRIKIKVLFSLLLLATVMSLLSYYFLSEIIELFAFKFNRGDGTSGRFELWSQGLQYFNFFGSSEYNNISNKYDVHNNYLSQALKYGVVPAVAFHAIPLFLFVKSYKRILLSKKLDFYLAMVLSMSSFLLVYYMFETASIIAPYWIMLFFSVCAYREIFFKNNTKKSGDLYV